MLCGQCQCLVWLFVCWLCARFGRRLTWMELDPTWTPPKKSQSRGRQAAAACGTSSSRLGPRSVNRLLVQCTQRQTHIVTRLASLGIVLSSLASWGAVGSGEGLHTPNQSDAALRWGATLCSATSKCASGRSGTKVARLGACLRVRLASPQSTQFPSPSVSSRGSSFRKIRALKHWNV